MTFGQVEPVLETYSIKIKDCQGKYLTPTEAKRRLVHRIKVGQEPGEIIVVVK